MTGEVNGLTTEDLDRDGRMPPRPTRFEDEEPEIGPGDFAGGIMPTPSDVYGLPPWLRSTIHTGDMVNPGYSNVAAQTELRSMPAEMVARLQEDLQFIRLLSPNYVPGEIDPDTIKALDNLMGIANVKNEDYQDVLARSIESVKLRDEALPDDLPPVDVYRPPAYSSIASEVKTLMRDMLRRDPTTAELALLGDELSGLYREAFDANVEASDIQTAAAEGEMAGAGRIVTGPEALDPTTELMSRMEQRFQGEVEDVEAIDERRDQKMATRDISAAFRNIVGGR